jgi:hypothetical protein
MRAVSAALLLSLDVHAELTWKDRAKNDVGTSGSAVWAKRRGDVGEGGMYI